MCETRYEYRFTVYVFYMFTSAFAVPFIHAIWLIALTRPECSGVTVFVLRSTPLQFLGWISYAMYCIHAPLFHWVAWAYAGRISADAVPMMLRYVLFLIMECFQYALDASSWWWDREGWMVHHDCVFVCVCLYVCV